MTSVKPSLSNSFKRVAIDGSLYSIKAVLIPSIFFEAINCGVTFFSELQQGISPSF